MRQPLSPDWKGWRSSVYVWAMHYPKKPHPKTQTKNHTFFTVRVFNTRTGNSQEVTESLSLEIVRTQQDMALSNLLTKTSTELDEMISRSVTSMTLWFYTTTEKNLRLLKKPYSKFSEPVDMTSDIRLQRCVGFENTLAWIQKTAVIDSFFRSHTNTCYRSRHTQKRAQGTVPDLSRSKSKYSNT